MVGVQFVAGHLFDARLGFASRRVANPDLGVPAVAGPGRVHVDAMLAIVVDDHAPGSIWII
jgi:hypothetical protein